MDPFSITVGALTLAGTLAATAKTLKKLVGLKKAPDELLQLINEISDFQLTVVKTEETIAALRVTDESDTLLEPLIALINRGNVPVAQLQQLLHDHILDSDTEVELHNSPKIEFSLRSWAKRQDEARRLQRDIKQVRSRINHVLLLHSWSAVPRFHSRLAEISTQNQLTNQHLKEITTFLKDAPQEPQGPITLEESKDTSFSSQMVRHTSSSSQSASAASSSPRDTATSILELSTELFKTKKCGAPICTCRCHSVSRLNPFPWASSIIGHLFIGYSGLPLPFLPSTKCNQKSCDGEALSLIKVTWYFPSWFLPAKTVISFVDKWTPLDGHDISITTPRIVPSSADIFTLAQMGSIDGVQQLLVQRKASVYDVSVTEGRSALHFALTADQPAMAAFLVQQRSNVSIEDHNSLSAIDLVWNYMLEDPDEPIHIAFKDVFKAVLDDSEDLQRRNFSPLHLIVFGLSSISLEAMLELTTADIDAVCSLGRTSLCWASLRRSPKPVEILVKKGAALHIADCRGQNAFHFAAETGPLESLHILLEAASDLTEDDSVSSNVEWQPHSVSVQRLIEARDYKGRTALHFATRMGQVAHAQLLIWYNADVDSPDSALNRTPLLMAIYWNYANMVQLLLDSGARTDVVDANGLTILHYAAKFGNTSTLAILSRVPLSNISSEAKDLNGLTPVQIFEHIRPEILREDEVEGNLARLLFGRILANASRTTECKE